MKLLFAISLLAVATVILPTTNARSPIVLINGILGSRLQTRNSQTRRVLGINVPRKCNTLGRHADTWIGLRLLGCGQDDLTMRYINGEFVDNEDVMVRVPDGLSGMTLVRAPVLGLPIIDYMGNLVRHFERLGYRRNRDIVGAPYDWRLAADNLENRGYFHNLKTTIMELYANNGNRKVTIVAHSMGGLVSHYFLTQFTNQQWRDKYIHAFVPLSGAWSGGALAVTPLISGKPAMGLPGFLHNLLADFLVPIVHTLQSITWLLPREDVFGDMVLIETPSRKYTAADYEQFFEDIGYEKGIEKLQNILTSVTPDFPSPNVPTFCFYGTGVETPERFIYNRDLSPDGHAPSPTIVYGDGDGTVNQVSSDVCLQWKTMDKPFMAVPFKGVSHLEMVSNSRVLRAIEEVVTS